MNVVVERELRPIHVGWSARRPRLRVAARGRTEDLADKNFQRLVRVILAGARRQGTLMDDVAALGYGIEEADDPEIRVVLADIQP